MDYSRNLKKKDIAMRVIAGWVVAAFIGALIGAGVDHIIIRNSEKKKTTATQKEITKILVETDEENPTTIAEITLEEINAADGYRVRLTPKCD